MDNACRSSRHDIRAPDAQKHNKRAEINLPKVSESLKSIFVRLNENDPGKMLKAMGRESLLYYLHTHELDSLLVHLNALKTSTVPLESKRLVWLIMSSFRNVARTSSKLSSYAFNLSNFFAFSDESSSEHKMITLPEIKGKPTFNDAQWRHLYGMRYILRNRSDVVDGADWFIFGDDDTWFNVPALSVFLAKYNPELPLAFGQIWTNSMLSLVTGGGGIVVSRAAFKALASAMLTERCPFFVKSDMTITFCLYSIGIVRVHDSRFHHFCLQPQMKKYWRNDIVSQFSFHYENLELRLSAMTCYVAKIYARPDLNPASCAECCEDGVPQNASLLTVPPLNYCPWIHHGPSRASRQLLKQMPSLAEKVKML